MSVALRHSGGTPYRHASAYSLGEGAKWLFLAIVFILPFQRVPFVNTNLFGIQGGKPFNLLSAGVLVYLLFRVSILSATDKIERTSIRVLLLYFVTFAIAFARSIPNAPLLHERLPDVFPESYLDYVMSYGMVPAFYMLPFLFILKRCRSFPEIETVVNVICVSILLLSASFIFVAAMNPSAALSGRASVNGLCEAYFGIHYNTMGTIYICTAPLLLYKALTRSAFWIVPVALSLLGLLLLSSRSALLTVAGSYVLILLYKRKFAVLAVGAAMVVIASVLWIAPTMDAILSIGFDGTSDVSADELLTGRVDFIWIPLLNEWTSDLGLFLFGAGRSGIITSEAWYTGALIQATHAHNAIIDFFLDCGAIATGILLVFMCIGISTAWRVGRRLHNDLYWALFACIVGYGISMFTEREVFPSFENMYLFPLIAMMVNLARLSSRARQTSA
ncbi:O-antigen ligase family protein [Bradyrhizobium embrapense]|uniref:O-antigen ligase family protein n=1 Tax=Bradyrhizobium embrapense TaxID=630921 RepID=UPI00067DD4E8|nr:O-antigen ligase family protein [Bradyrhizobium embrapense]